MELQVIIYKGLNADYAVLRYIVESIYIADDSSIKHLIVTVFDSLLNRYEDLNRNFPF